MGMDTSSPGWEDLRLGSAESARAANEHLTGGLVFYYELKIGEPRPFPKVYLPVRHYCSDDLSIAKGTEAFYRSEGKLVDSYADKVKKIFGSHRTLDSRTGIHTYLSLAIKKKNFDITTYFNPEAYAVERVYQPSVSFRSLGVVTSPLSTNLSNRP